MTIIGNYHHHGTVRGPEDFHPQLLVSDFCAIPVLFFNLFLSSSLRGLRYFSKHRKLRIKLIAQHLSENDYDIVFLQEVSALNILRH